MVKTKKCKDKKCMWTQNNVDTKTDLVKFRVKPSLKKRMKGRAEETGICISEMTRVLWENYFNKLDEIQNKIDVEDFILNYNKK